MSTLAVGTERCSPCGSGRKVLVERTIVDSCSTLKLCRGMLANPPCLGDRRSELPGLQRPQVSQVHSLDDTVRYDCYSAHRGADAGCFLGCCGLMPSLTFLPFSLVQEMRYRRTMRRNSLGNWYAGIVGERHSVAPEEVASVVASVLCYDLVLFGNLFAA